MSASHPTVRSAFLCGLLFGFCPLLTLVLLVVFAWASSRAVSPEEVEFSPRGGFEFARDPEAFDPTPTALPRIDPAMPVAGLLPAPPATRVAPVYLGDDLGCVPELMLEAATPATTQEWRGRKSRAAAAALHLNGKDDDGFLKAVLGTRADLAGLPFAMGAACRSDGEAGRSRGRRRR